MLPVPVDKVLTICVIFFPEVLNVGNSSLNSHLTSKTFSEIISTVRISSFAANNWPL